MQLKQGNTTRALLFMMVDSGDHLTGKTGLSPTVTISKNGGSFASPSGAITELANGWYKLAADSDDADTLGQLIVHAEDSGADPVDVVFEVVAYNPDDSTKLGLSIFPANFDQMAIISGSGYARVAAELYYDSVADDYRVLPSHLQLLEIDGSGIASAKLADGVTHGGSGSTIQAGTIAASIATVAGNSIITSGTGSHQLTTTSGQVTVGTNNDKTGYALTSAYDSAKTAAQAGDAMALTSPERSTLVAAVWAVTTSTLTTSGTIGKLIVDNLNAAVGGVAASVWAYATRILTAGTNIVLAKGTGVTGLNDLDAAGVRSAVGLASANVDTQLSAIKAQADKVGTNSGDSSNTVTLQGRVTANVATYAQVAALTAPDNTGIANTLTQATQANTAAAAALSAAQSAQSSASSAAAAANTAATQAANAAAIANTHAVTIASDGLRLLPFGKPTAAPTNLGQALEMLAYGATCKMGGPCSGPGTITLYDADGNAFATRVAQFANGGQTITALVLS
jgi:hypothetical protein